MNQRFSLTPLLETHLGYDSLFKHLESFLAGEVPTKAGANNYPPINIIKDKTDGSYSIEVALAGFKRRDIKIEHDRTNHMLKISGGDSAAEALNPEKYELIRGRIARRPFSTAFTIAEDLDVSDAKFEDGLLTIKLQTVARADDTVLVSIS